jgi:tetratricopeptide (TPR) repeat protein
MKRTTILLIVWLAAAGAVDAADPLQETLQRGLFEEEANRDLDAAIEAYRSVVARYDTNRHIAATAVFRLAESYRKKGMTNEAAARYQRVLRDFSDQETLVNLSRERLAEAGVTVAEGEGKAAGVPDTEAVQARAVLEQLLKLNKSELRHVLPTVVPDPLLRELIRSSNAAEVELQWKEQNLGSDHPDRRRSLAMIETLGDQIDARIEGILTGLKIRAAAAETGTTERAESETIAGVRPATAEEAEEIRRLQAMIRNSPDLINAGASSPLLTAAARGHLAAVKLLLANGADPDVRGPRNRIPKTVQPQNEGGQRPTSARDIPR